MWKGWTKDPNLCWPAESFLDSLEANWDACCSALFNMVPGTENGREACCQLCWRDSVAENPWEFITSLDDDIPNTDGCRWNGVTSWTRSPEFEDWGCIARGCPWRARYGHTWVLLEAVEWSPNAALPKKSWSLVEREKMLHNLGEKKSR